MSFNTLSEENKEFIVKLYGLKAGLSLLSSKAAHNASKIASGIEMQNALLDKSNVTSAQLASDMNYMVERYKLTGRL